MPFNDTRILMFEARLKFAFSAVGSHNYSDKHWTPKNRAESTDKRNRNPPVTTNQRDLFTPWRKASMFPQTSAMIIAAVKNKTVG